MSSSMNQEEEERSNTLADRSIEIDPNAIMTKLDVSKQFGKMSTPARIMIAGPTLAGIINGIYYFAKYVN